MAKAERSIEINAPIETVWKVITDYERYPEFLADAKRMVIRNRSASGVEVENEISVVGTSVKYTLRMVENAPKSVSWSLVSGAFMKSNDGSWKLESISPERTKATYSIDIGVGLLVPKTIINALVDTGLPKMLDQFRGRAESQVGKG
ncbi:MAG: SRPBCC family protein [Deltaproteobacteria bacterium]|nr:SRPBCC family protein [Deltaproteobacteria bacterium]